MSSRSRILVVSGTPGSGTSSVAHALARHRGGALIHHERRFDAGGDRWLQLLSASLSDVETQLAAALVRVDELRAISHAVAQERDVVWDAGTVEDCVHVLAALDALPILVAALDPQAQAAFADVIEEGMALRTRLLGAESEFVVVVSTARGEQRRLRLASAQFVTLGLAVDDVVINRVPRRGDAWPKAWAKRRRRRARGLVHIARRCGATAVRLPWLPTEAIGHRRLARELAALDGARKVPRGTCEVGAVDGDGYTWRVPVGLATGEDVRFGRVADDAVIVVGGMTRVLPLPSVIARCRLDTVALRDGALIVSASPNADVWRAS